MNEQDKINATLNLSSKNLTNNSNIFNELFNSYPNVVNLDLSDNQLTSLPEDLSPLSKLQFLDIQGNLFNDVILLFYLYFYIFLNIV